MTCKQFQKEIDNQNIDHQTALKLISLMWPTFQRCNDLITARVC